MEIEYIDIEKDKEEISFVSQKKQNFSYSVSPFRPEMFGSLIYATIYYIANMYDIELVMHGEANMLPMHSLYSDRSICYNADPLYKSQKKDFNKNREVLIEHIQRAFNNIIPQEVRFGSRFGVRPSYEDNKILGGLLAVVSSKTGKTKQQIMQDISYSDVKNFMLKIFSERKIFLTQASKKCLEKIKDTIKGNLWFCSHHKPRFMAFENYINTEIPESVIQESLWCNKQEVQDIILDIDANSLLSTQILASKFLDVRFIASGGATTLFQTIPDIDTVHLTIWDYYTLEYDDIKSQMMRNSGLSHKVFHVGGLLNNSQPIPFLNDPKINPMPIPAYAKRLDIYDGNILNYIEHTGDCLIEQKQKELNEIIEKCKQKKK